MKQYQWNVELIRKVDGEYKTIKASKVWAFDDECLEQNIWGEAVYEFKDELQVGDIIKTCGYHTTYLKYTEDGTGLVLNY